MNRARGGAQTSPTIRAAVSAEAERALMAWRAAAGGLARIPGSKPVDDLHRLQRARCYLCGSPFQGARGRAKLSCTRDHVFPRAEGGQKPGNILLAHKLCNERKSGRWPTPCEVLFLAAVYAS